jgi:hypothetical protein
MIPHAKPGVVSLFCERFIQKKDVDVPVVRVWSLVDVADMDGDGKSMLFSKLILMRTTFSVPPAEERRLPHELILHSLRLLL